MSQFFKQLSSAFWTVQSKFYFTNSGIFLDDGIACLIDPGVYPDEIKRIRSFINEKSSRLDCILLTHCHWDHILGPEFFPGSKTITQAAYADNLNERRKARIHNQVAEWEKQENIKREKDFFIPLPDQTFDQNLSLKVGNLSLDLIHAPGHATEQMVIYQAESRILCAADMLSDIDIPYVSDNLSAYEDTLEKLSKLEIEILIPGHGQVTMESAQIRERILAEKEYLAELRTRVEKVVLEGKTIREALDYCKGMKFQHQTENERPHRLNIESVYLELGGKGDELKLGW